MSVDFRLVAAVVLTAITGCSEPPTAMPSNAVPALRATESFRDFGDYVVHFNAITTERLTPEIARQYDIVRSSRRGMLNVSILRKQEGTSGVPVSGSVVASAVNLAGQRKELTLREIREETAVYYIAEFAIANEETLIFTIDVTPLDETSNFSVRYTKQFYVN